MYSLKTTLPKLDLVAREKVLTLEREIGKLPQFDCPLRHFFADGVYVREIFIPAGVALVGYIHMQSCVTTISKGAIAITEGNGSKVLRAPYTVECVPGTKKAGYALEDTVWCDAYANPDNERDITTLEARLTANTHEEFLLRYEQKLLETRS